MTDVEQWLMRHQQRINNTYTAPAAPSSPFRPTRAVCLNVSTKGLVNQNLANYCATLGNLVGCFDSDAFCLYAAFSSNVDARHPRCLLDQTQPPSTALAVPVSPEPWCVALKRLTSSPMKSGPNSPP